MRAVLSALILLTILLTAGCDKEEPIAFYRAPKDPPTTAPSFATATSSPLHWKLPGTWRQLPNSQQMRFATFAVNDANPPVELTVTALGPEAADIPPNVIRWQQQLGLPPSPPADIARLVKRVSPHNLEVAVIDLATPAEKLPAQRLLAAILPHAGRVWFFKLLGPADVVSAEKENFDAFIASLEPASPAPTTPAAPTEASARPSAPSALAHWTAPPGWTEIPNPKPPRMLGFKIGPGDSGAEVIVTRLPASAAGNFLDNINRWRNQIGLEPITDPNSVPMQEITLGKDGQGLLLDFSDTAAPPRRMLVAIRNAGDDLWFIKLTGPADGVATQKDAFSTFLKTLEFAAQGASLEPHP